MRFEYKQVKCEGEYIETQLLDKIGMNEWELVSVVFQPGTQSRYSEFYYFFKREIKEEYAETFE